jgi:hypothetical protein
MSERKNLVRELKAEFERTEAAFDALLAAGKLALDASQKFIDKVDRGQAKSVVTYAELSRAVAALKKAGVK